MLRLRVNLKHQKENDENEDDAVVQLYNDKAILEATRQKMLELRLNVQQSKGHNNVTTAVNKLVLEEETEEEEGETEI